MPPETAKHRYRLTLQKHTPETAWIKVKPRRRADAANWSEVQIILDRTTSLPLHVRIVDTTGNGETVYSFSDFQVNKKRRLLIRDRDPFKPNLRGYEVITRPFDDVVRPLPELRPGEKLIPDIAGLPWKDARTALKRSGFDPRRIRWLRKITDDPARIRRVSHTEPPTRTAAYRDAEITVYVWTDQMPERR